MAIDPRVPPGLVSLTISRIDRKSFEDESSLFAEIEHNKRN